MISVAIPNRPFSTDLITGVMLPDGIFESSLGKQRLNAHFVNQAATVAAQVYVESVSHPGVLVTPATHNTTLVASGPRVLSWNVDVSAAPPGKHLVSFIVESGADRVRIIKKIFVTRVSFDPTTQTFHAACPEGSLQVGFRDLLRPGKRCCGGRRPGTDDKPRNILDALGQFTFDPRFKLCPTAYLIKEADLAVTPTPPYTGQFGDLPYQDPWWKVLLCIIALILLIAAAIAEATGGSGEISTTGGPGGAESPTGDCCGLEPSGGGTSYVAAGLVAAAAAAATAAVLSDVRDPFRRGQDNTPPAPGATTLKESVHYVVDHIEPVALGRPFKVNVKWEYTRQTTAGNLTHTVSETQQNVHVLDNYQITAPDVVRIYKREPFRIQAQFFGPGGRQFRGSELLVQCFLIGPEGDLVRLTLQDDGFQPDDKPNDGIYTAIHFFTAKDTSDNDPRGLWHYFVIAQDVNNAQPDMTPEEAAKIIGGMVLTHQLVVTFDPATDCPFVPDGHVNVV